MWRVVAYFENGILVTSPAFWPLEWASHLVLHAISRRQELCQIRDWSRGILEMACANRLCCQHETENRTVQRGRMNINPVQSSLKWPFLGEGTLDSGDGRVDCGYQMDALVPRGFFPHTCTRAFVLCNRDKRLISEREMGLARSKNHVVVITAVNIDF
mgnify:CR=1 FL=1